MRRQSDTSTLTPKEKNRFYEVLLLLKALYNVLPARRNKEDDDAGDIARHTSEGDKFKCFVNQVSKILDNVPRGETISAVSLLWDDARVLYVFASNKRRNQNDIEIAELLLKEIIDHVGRAGVPEEQGPSYRALVRWIFDRVVWFHKKRVKMYTRELSTQLLACRSLCGKSGNPFPEELVNLERYVDLVEPRESNRDIWIDQVGKLVECLGKIKQTTAWQEVKRRKADSKMTNCPWSELRHAMGRLLGYRTLAGTVVQARSLWPEAFDDVEVRGLPASQPEEQSFRKLRNKLQNPVAGIVNRMASGLTRRSELPRFQQIAEELYHVGLGERLEAVYTEKGFQAIVHAETLLLNWIVLTGIDHQADTDGRGGSNELSFSVDADRFFLGNKYIGASKPACRPCSYYFEAHPARVLTRSMHGNLYTAWRIPDAGDITAFSASGGHGDGARSAATAAAFRDQQAGIIGEVLGKLRRDAFGAMEERRSSGRRHDSNTYSGLLEGLTSRFGGLSDAAQNEGRQQHHERYERELSPADSISMVGTGGFNTEDEDDDACGGVRI